MAVSRVVGVDVVSDGLHLFTVGFIKLFMNCLCDGVTLMRLFPPVRSSGCRKEVRGRRSNGDLRFRAMPFVLPCRFTGFWRIVGAGTSRESGNRSPLFAPAKRRCPLLFAISRYIANSSKNGNAGHHWHVTREWGLPSYQRCPHGPGTHQCLTLHSLTSLQRRYHSSLPLLQQEFAESTPRAKYLLSKRAAPRGKDIGL